MIHNHTISNDIMHTILIYIHEMFYLTAFTSLRHSKLKFQVEKSFYKIKLKKKENFFLKIFHFFFVFWIPNLNTFIFFE